MVSPKFLEHIAILRFERRYPKANSVIRLKSNIFPPKIFYLDALLAEKLPLQGTGIPLIDIEV